jgi:hypothetical protein
MADDEVMPVWLVVDYENTRRVGHRMFGATGTPFHTTVIHPRLLAAQIIAARATDGAGRPPVKIIGIDVHVGLPSARREPFPNAISQAQHARWTTVSGIPVKVFARPLVYTKHEKLSADDFVVGEKGVDLAAAIRAIELTQASHAPVRGVILASEDTDFRPLVDYLVKCGDTLIETCSWQGAGLASPDCEWNTVLGKQHFEQSLDRFDYAADIRRKRQGRGTPSRTHVFRNL